MPLLGYIPWLSGTPYIDFHEMRKRYGDMFSVRLGKRWHVVLNGSTSIRRALVENGAACSGRPNWILNRILKGKGINYIWCNAKINSFYLYKCSAEFLVTQERVKALIDGKCGVERKGRGGVGYFNLPY